MNSDASCLLAAEGLTVTAGGSRLLDSVDLALPAGRVLGVVGPSGAGKSTLLKTLAGLVTPTAGTIVLNGRPLASYEGPARARQLAWLEQRPQVQWPLTVRQVVALGRLPYDNPSPDAVSAALDTTSTTELSERAFHTLSEGERMRVHLARIFAGTPQIVLADEPVAALDPWHQWHTLELLRAQAANGVGVLVVLHDLALAARFCDALVLLDRGQVAAHGPPRSVLTPDTLAAIWRLNASLDSATLNLVIHNRLP